MKKSYVSLAIIAALTASVLLPYSSHALTNEEIDRELAKITKQEQEAARKRADAAAEKQKIAAEKNQVARSLNEIMAKINEQGQKLTELQEQIDEEEANLRNIVAELRDAENRVASRNELLHSRVKLMYTDGFVSYLDVLLSSNSFSDFLSRFDAIQTILNQDKRLLEAYQADRDLIADSKVKQEEKMSQLRDLYAQAESVRQALVLEEKEKQNAVMILSRQEQEVESIDEEQEKYLVELSRKKSKLYEERRKNSQKNGEPFYKGGKLEWPLPGKYTITSGFGTRTDPFSKKKASHKGVDIGAPQGTTIVAAEAGTVIIAQWVNGYGNTVVIDHGGGLWTWYGHIRYNGIAVEEGETVNRGDKIAEVGSTGQSTGPHLHFEVRKDEVPVNPMPYLK